MVRYDMDPAAGLPANGNILKRLSYTLHHTLLGEGLHGFLVYHAIHAHHISGIPFDNNRIHFFGTVVTSALFEKGTCQAGCVVYGKSMT